MHKGGAGGEAHKEDYEEFLHDIESDAHARSNVDMYKDPAMWRISQVSTAVPTAKLSWPSMSCGPPCLVSWLPLFRVCWSVWARPL